MKSNVGKLLAGGFLGAALLVQGSVSWASNILAENTVDTIFLSSGAGLVGNITYTDTQSNWLGSVAVNHIVVGSDGSTSNGLSNGTPNALASTPTGIGSFVTGLDGSIQPNLVYDNGGTNAALVQPAVTIAPAGPDPLVSDFNIVASVIAASIDPSVVTATARGSYLQSFMLTAADLVTLNFSNFYSFQLNGSGTAHATSRYGYSIDGGAFIYSPVVDALLTDANPVLQNPLGPTTEIISLGTLAAGLHTFELVADVTGEAVPEPGTCLLFGAGILALAGYRLRRRC